MKYCEYCVWRLARFSDAGVALIWKKVETFEINLRYIWNLRNFLLSWYPVKRDMHNAFWGGEKLFDIIDTLYWFCNGVLTNKHETQKQKCKDMTVYFDRAICCIYYWFLDLHHIVFFYWASTIYQKICYPENNGKGRTFNYRTLTGSLDKSHSQRSTAMPNERISRVATYFGFLPCMRIGPEH